MWHGTAATPRVAGDGNDFDLFGVGGGVLREEVEDAAEKMSEADSVLTELEDMMGVFFDGQEQVDDQLCFKGGLASCC